MSHRPRTKYQKLCWISDIVSKISVYRTTSRYQVGNIASSDVSYRTRFGSANHHSAPTERKVNFRRATSTTSTRYCNLFACCLLCFFIYFCFVCLSFVLLGSVCIFLSLLPFLPHARGCFLSICLFLFFSSLDYGIVFFSLFPFRKLSGFLACVCSSFRVQYAAGICVDCHPCYARVHHWRCIISA